MKDIRATKLDIFIINSTVNPILITKLLKFMVFPFLPYIQLEDASNAD